MKNILYKFLILTQIGKKKKKMYILLKEFIDWKYLVTFQYISLKVHLNKYFYADMQPFLLK